ncbi:PREDICTED: zinc transporter ZIP1-like [Gekko japonicus]|uniref:Zinc transporter ZIP1-like n=1 Tax=Gekko japonicus TaxID=146911 RepID=A0ABM1JWP2_GEKJA|nr:PREDICTED: zinc transporter ZIP1-like [Gekko japonicus]
MGDSSCAQSWPPLRRRGGERSPRRHGQGGGAQSTFRRRTGGGRAPSGLIKAGHFDERYVLSSRVRTGRSIRGLSMPPACTRAERREVERVASDALGGLAGDLAGKYYRLSDMTEKEQQQLIDLDFPLPELILALGFLLVLVTEHVVLDCSEPPGDEATLLLPPGLEEQEGSRRRPSRFRSLVLTLALSLHSVFEGLAVGLQDSPGRVLQLAGAILLLGLLLLQSRLPLRWLATALGTFVLMSPLGVGLGMAVMHGSGPGSTTARSLLQGMAAGTFMYVTFLEILPQELSSPAGRLPNVLAVLLGFSGVAGLRLLG